MKDVKDVIYRFLTDAEFFNIYKPPKTEAGGGGQTYIDFKTKFIPVLQWESFFDGVVGLTVGTGAKGPTWTSPVYSVGVSSQPQQTMLVYQRRSASVCISSQYIHSKKANRVSAWHPSNGFPQPSNPADRQQLPDGLVVFLVRTFDNEVWAGWANVNNPANKGWADTSARLLLSPMFAAARQPGDAGILTFTQGQLHLDTNNAQAPIVGGSSAVIVTIPTKKTKAKKHRVLTEQELLDTLFNEDESDSAAIGGKQKTVILKIRQRNQSAVKALKELYHNRCQISGAQLTFKKQDGKYYSEAHHLVPLGVGGADDPRNIIIVSPLIHKMLHYAFIEGIDLTKIKNQPSGEGTLEILVNGEEMIITWHAEHVKRVLGT